MAKFIEAENRMFKNVFVCKACKRKIRAPYLKIIAKTVICPNCGSKAFRPKRRK
jgi:DNA-directed RNA polymerase subunit RPC12/RpoP